jgi:acyl carrier protein
MRWRFLNAGGRNFRHIVFSGAVMSVRSDIVALFEQVAEEQHKTLAPLTDDLGLLESGLDSLCFAVIVARLEDDLGVDPFSTEDDVGFPVTIGDFIALFERAAEGGAD